MTVSRLLVLVKLGDWNFASNKFRTTVLDRRGSLLRN